MKTLRIYIDTSVVGGCLDDEFFQESKALFELVKKGVHHFLISELLLDEISLAPLEVQELLQTLPDKNLEPVSISLESVALQNLYIGAGVLGSKHENDAHHVALATIARADLIVSWNFKHIVHFDKIRAFNAVNLKEGYQQMEMRTPREVV